MLQQIADYELIRSLGEASYGEFFLAKPPARLGLDAEYVTVKVLAGMAGDDAFRRATRELKAFAAADSPYLVSVYDAGQQGHTFFYSMEHSPLGTLAAPAERLTPAQIAGAVADAARATHALHEAGVLHRSISPATIVVKEGGGGKLADLGLADLVNPGQTATSVGGVGSVAFLDPSILLGARASRSTDIWSLGATLHDVLAGTGLFGDLPPEPLSAIRKVLGATPTVSGDLPAEHAAIIERCIAPIGERYQTAEQLADDLDRLR